MHVSVTSAVSCTWVFLRSFSIDSSPYATIFVDGTNLGVTPLVGKSLPPGKHTVKAVTKDGRTRTFDITVAPGKLTNRGTLTW